MAEEETIHPALEPTSLDQISRDWLKSKLNVIEEETGKDVLAILGPIEHGVDIPVRIALEKLHPHKKNIACYIRHSGRPGRGSAKNRYDTSIFLCSCRFCYSRPYHVSGHRVGNVWRCNLHGLFFLPRAY